MRISAVSVLLALILWGFPLAPGWSQDAEVELRRLSEEMKEAKRRARYEAEQTVYDFSGKGVRFTRFRVAVAYPHRRQESISGPQENRCIVLEDGRHMWSYFPARKVVVKEPIHTSEGLIPDNLSQTMQLLLRNYRLTIRGPVPLRGQPCRIVEFLPQWQDRPRREIWLEEERKVPLRAYISYPDGRPVYRSETEKIDWDPNFAPETFHLKVPRDTRVYEIKKEENLSIEKAERLLNQRMMLPPFAKLGYTPYNIILRSEEGKRRLQVVFTDGLSSFSIFREWFVQRSEKAGKQPTGAQQASQKPRSMGKQSAAIHEKMGPFSLHRYGLINVVTLEHGNQRTICVGDILEERLKEIAHSLRLHTSRNEPKSEPQHDPVHEPSSSPEMEPTP